jgi:hypothetical protein
MDMIIVNASKLYSPYIRSEASSSFLAFLEPVGAKGYSRSTCSMTVALDGVSLPDSSLHA